MGIKNQAAFCSLIILASIRRSKIEWPDLPNAMKLYCKYINEFFGGKSQEGSAGLLPTVLLFPRIADIYEGFSLTYVKTNYSPVRRYISRDGQMKEKVIEELLSKAKRGINCGILQSPGQSLMQDTIEYRYESRGVTVSCVSRCAFFALAS